MTCRTAGLMTKLLLAMSIPRGVHSGRHFSMRSGPFLNPNLTSSGARLFVET